MTTSHISPLFRLVSHLPLWLKRTLPSVIVTPCDGAQLAKSVLALSGNDAGALIRLAHGQETEWLEFKAAICPEKRNGEWCIEKVANDQDRETFVDYQWNVTKAMIAMANNKGGGILLGVDDRGRSVGLDASDPDCVCKSKVVDEFVRLVLDPYRCHNQESGTGKRKVPSA